MANLLCQDNAITSADEFIKNVYEREAEGLTGIGDGIAIPHGKSNAVIKNCIAVCKLKEPIEWASIDHQPVSLVILFAVMRDAPATTHLKMMAGVARALADTSVCSGIKKAQTPAELIMAFNSHGATTERKEVTA